MRVDVSINTSLTDLAAVSPLLEYPSLKSLVGSMDGATASTHDAIRALYRRPRIRTLLSGQFSEEAAASKFSEPRAKACDPVELKTVHARLIWPLGRYGRLWRVIAWFGGDSIRELMP